jgi:GH24 family phage-related lysozyme (muramidase)
MLHALHVLQAAAFNKQTGRFVTINVDGNLTHTQKESMVRFFLQSNLGAGLRESSCIAQELRTDVYDLAAMH